MVRIVVGAGDREGFAARRAILEAPALGRLGERRLIQQAVRAVAVLLRPRRGEMRSAVEWREQILPW